jgi:hypothetical protein
VGLIELIIVLAVVGVILFLIETYIPMAAPIKTIIRVVVVIVVCLWLLQMFVGDIPIPGARQR